MSSRAYLERTVVPVVMEGMTALAKERLDEHLLMLLLVVGLCEYCGCYFNVETV